ncbi:MAG TPA: methyltransferase domain-containing protein [Candidatus Anoxymicrobiaceae bacterium]
MKIGRPSDKTWYDWISIFRSYGDRVRPCDIVLEIGASNTERTMDLASRCDRVIGVELMPERVPDPTFNVKYVAGDWQRLSGIIEPGSVDIAVANQVIEHVTDDLKALNELYEVLKPGGMALISTPNRKRLVRALVETFRPEREFPWWEHVREYTEEDFLALLEASKFERWEIHPVVLGIHGGPVFVYLERVPERFRRFANFWLVHLYKE